MTEQTNPPAPPAPEVQPTAPVAPAPAAPPAPAQETAPAAPERPSWLPEGFSTPEELAAAYAALKGTDKPADPTPPKDPAQVAEEAGLPDPSKLNDGDAQFLLSQKGLNVAELSEEYLSKGGLSAETYAKLEAGGFPKAFVDAWIEGREAAAEQHRTKLYALVGGEEAFTKVQEWAKVNVPRSALDAYNNAVATGSVELMGLAMQGLHARYVAANGERPELIGGDASSAVVDGYATQADAVAAMRDPKYRNDPSYRAEVERKLAARPVFNARTTR